MNNQKIARVIIGALVVIVGGFAIKAWINGDSYSCDKTPIVAKEGDDYWGYVEQYCDGNKQNAADDIVDFYGSTLMPGRLIHLPASDKCELSLWVADDGQEYVYETCE